MELTDQPGKLRTMYTVRTCSALWEGYYRQDFVNCRLVFNQCAAVSMETILCNARAWPQQCCEKCENGSNIVALRFGDHGKKKCWKLLAKKFDQFQTSCNNSKHTTTSNRVCKCKRTQQVTPNNVGSCWPTMLGVAGQQCWGLLANNVGCCWPIMVWVAGQQCWGLLANNVVGCWQITLGVVGQHC